MKHKAFAHAVLFTDHNSTINNNSNGGSNSIDNRTATTTTAFTPSTVSVTSSSSSSSLPASSFSPVSHRYISNYPCSNNNTSNGGGGNSTSSYHHDHHHHPLSQQQQQLPHRISPMVAWDTLECIYPRYPDLDQLNITDIDRLVYIRYYSLLCRCSYS